jgi:hypothetical protein
VNEVKSWADEVRFPANVVIRNFIVTFRAVSGGWRPHVEYAGGKAFTSGIKRPKLEDNHMQS